jgi:hypothetical protein
MKKDMQYHLDYGEMKTGEESVAERNLLEYAAENGDNKASLFWRFPRGKGAIQPWRRRLWELQNHSDHE